ncbi:SprT family protein [Staphylococcus succinus]|uniref:SprT family protein n=1 Tax=Staphylococcus succinus TaxID=61015 RepID=UPI000E6891C8|nr:SprT family protein [Staphylococcus succinus]RIN36863.1 SprT family protein [Staphylococcus succinus]
MDNKTLQRLTETISEEYFGMPFKHKAYFNKRLKTTGGRYLLRNHNIEVNEKQYYKFGQEAIESIIKHELCHYHLHIQGKGYKHKDNDFKVLSTKTGAPRYCAALKTYEERANYIYKCNKCEMEFPRIRKVDTAKMVCGHCKGELVQQK